MSKSIIVRGQAVLCAFLCAISFALPCYAEEVSTPITTIETRMANITDAQCKISVANGKAAVRIDLSGRKGAERCEIFLTIEKKVGNKWVSVGSWSEKTDGRFATMTKSVTTTKGVSYRANTTVTVWLEGKAESKTITSDAKVA